MAISISAGEHLLPGVVTGHAEALAAQGQVVGVGVGDGGHRAQWMKVESPGSPGSGSAAADDADSVLYLR
jgi:hypothetical protein